MKSLRGLKNKTTDKDLAKDPTTTCQVNFGAHGLKVQETIFIIKILGTESWSRSRLFGFTRRGW